MRKSGFKIFGWPQAETALGLLAGTGIYALMHISFMVNLTTCQYHSFYAIRTAASRAFQIFCPSMLLAPCVYNMPERRQDSKQVQSF